MGSTSSRKDAEVFISQDKFVAELNFFPKVNDNQRASCNENQPPVKKADGGFSGSIKGKSVESEIKETTNSLNTQSTERVKKDEKEPLLPKPAAMTKDLQAGVDMKEILLTFKKEHRSSYVYLSECEKIIRGLKMFEANGELASEAAFFKGDQLAEFSAKVAGEKEHLEVVTSFLIAVGLPQLLVQSMQSLIVGYPDAQLYDREKENSSTEILNKEEHGTTRALSQQTKWAQDVMSSLCNATLTFTDSHDEFCEVCCAYGMISIHLKLVDAMKDCIPDMMQFEDRETKVTKQFTERGKFLFRVMGVLHNLAKRPTNKKLFNKCNVIPILLPLIRAEVTWYAVEALLTVAYLVNEKNNDLIMADQEPMRLIIHMLDKASKAADHRYQGFTAAEIASGLSHLASNDNNNKMIGQHGAIPLLVSMMKEGRSEEEIEAATRALYTLVFEKQNREQICNDESTMRTLRLLKSSNNQAIQRSACGALWEIERRNDLRQQAGDTAQRSQHIMISYQWDSQPAMLQVKQRLQEAGFEVWLDLDKMGGSILEAMARAVENASVILVGVSQKYQDSPNCRSEAEYAYQRRKPIIPLMMEHDYQPDGWLGIIVGTKLWMDFREDVQTGLTQLNKELIQHLRGKEPLQTAASKVTRSSHADLVQGKRGKVYCWKNEDVARWFEDIGLSVRGNEVRQRLDGPLLVQLHDLRNESPDFFYNSIKADLGLPTVIDVIQFTEELRKLVG